MRGLAAIRVTEATLPSSGQPERHPIYHWLKTLISHDQLGPWLIGAGLKIAAALTLLLIGLWIARRLSRVTVRLLSKTHTDVLLTNFLRHVTFAIIMAVVVVAALGAIGVQTTSLLAVLGAAGLAIGMALKDSLSNIASGMMLVTLRPFHVGDTVTVSGQTGTVDSVSIFQTVLVGADNQVFTIPNSLITTNPIINLTARSTRRIEIVLPVSPASNIEHARETALSVITSDPRVLGTPSPEVVVDNLGGSTVGLAVRCHVRTDDWGAVQASIKEALKLAFDRANICISPALTDLNALLWAMGTMRGKEGTDRSATSSRPPAPQAEQSSVHSPGDSA